MMSMSTPLVRAAGDCVCAAVLLLSLGASAQTVETAAPTAQASSDLNVPPATARQQAAEIARGAPARWSQEDVTMAARLKTMRKEIAAALQESQGACRNGPREERAACLKQARDTYNQDMAGVRGQLTAGQ